jgi:hypothetical protein
MEVSQSNVVLVMEGRDNARDIAPFAAERWPGRQVLVVYTRSLALFEFRYPEGLTEADYPYVGEPGWKLRDSEWAKSDFVVELLNGELEKTELDPFQVIKSAGEIWFAAHPGFSGANSFEVLLTHCLGAEEARRERPALILTAIWESKICRVLEITTTEDPKYRQWSAKGRARHFFDYNFNINSQALLTDCLRKVGVDDSNPRMDEYSLQFLYWIRKRYFMAENLSSGKEWVGSGRSQIKLRNMGLLAFQHGLAVITVWGNDFLNLLHPDCENPDRVALQDAWHADWPNSKEQMSSYLREFFGKQLEYKAAAR